MREYSPAQELINNTPYLAMTVLGTIIFVAGLGSSVRGLIVAGTYLIYGLIGALWIMIFVCPYCQYFNTNFCPCGYGKIAAKFREKSPEDMFSEKFKKHITVIIPLWIIPLIEGMIFLLLNYNLTLLILVIAFTLNSFIILPLLARIYGCGHCPQKNDCPWMFKKSA